MAAPSETEDTVDSAELPAGGGTVQTHRDNQYIEILIDDGSFPWQYTDAGGVTWQTEFELRMVPDDTDKKWRNELTKRKHERGGVVEKLNSEEYVRRVLEYAIVSWKNLLNARDQSELPCVIAYKMKLPERLKTEIVRLCVGKEGGMALAAARGEEKND